MRDAQFSAGDRVGSFHITRLIGRGGMGTVYAATRSDGAFSQQVAIKVVDRLPWRPDITRRFHAERQALASLGHANIARLIDGGATDSGQPYLVMDCVEGRPIDVYCDDLALDIPARVALFLQVCSAVQHAHERLIVHRDLKPDNVLVGADGVPKLLDFICDRTRRARARAASAPKVRTRGCAD